MHGRFLLALALAAAALPAAAQRSEVPAPIRAANCETGLRQLNPVVGWQVRWATSLRQLASQPGVPSAALAEWRGAGAAVHADIATLRQGMGSGRTVPVAVVDRVLAQARALQGQLAATPLAAQPDWHQLLDRELRPAVDVYVDFLANTYRPHATAGSVLHAIPEGEACFAEAVTSWTTLRRSPDELEAAGRALLAEARRDLARAAGVRETELPRVLAELRRPVAGTTREELLAVSGAATARARAALPRWFDAGALPPIAIEPIPAGQEADAVAGIYRPATGSAPAAYVVNLGRPEERRLMAEVIAFHETLPGHHLAFARQTSPGQFNSGFIEGWAIYAEYLADEMKLYGTARDRIGMHAKHLWAASRLIVEPGLHVRGWTRDQAIDFMRSNTALSDAEIAVEVDRYLAMPGQSLAYMLGADQLRRARTRAEKALGPRFDVRRFHTVVLSPGPRSLDRVNADVDAWLAAVQREGRGA